MCFVSLSSGDQPSLPQKQRRAFSVLVVVVVVVVIWVGVGAHRVLGELERLGRPLANRRGQLG